MRQPCALHVGTTPSAKSVRGGHPCPPPLTWILGMQNKYEALVPVTISQTRNNFKNGGQECPPHRLAKKVPVSRHHELVEFSGGAYLPSSVPVAPNSRRATVRAGRAMGSAPAAAP